MANVKYTYEDGSSSINNVSPNDVEDKVLVRSGEIPVIIDIKGRVSYDFIHTFLKGIVDPATATLLYKGKRVSLGD